MVPAYKLHEEQMHDVPRDLRETVTTIPVRRAARRANPYIVLPVIGLLLFGAGLGLVNQRVQWMTLTYELEEARQQLVGLQQTNARLQVAVAGAVSLDKTETAARSRLGMVDPGSRTAIVVAPDASASVAMAEMPSTWSQAGAWLRERLTTTAEAGERAPK